MTRPYRTRQDERDVFRALAHPARRQIVEAALDQNCSFAYLRKITNRSDATLAGHLRILRDAGILTTTRDQRHVTYRAHRNVLRPDARWLATLAAPPEPGRRAKSA